MERLRAPMKFEIISPLKPAGSQPEAIEQLASGYDKYQFQTLLGITGSGKTFTMANVIERVGKPTLVLAHNKTLAAQLYHELKELFPKNRVEYFVSYYDYYQPESYVPASDTYIEKDAQVNAQIDKMRLKATASLMSRKDVIIVSSVSCIYGLGDPKSYFDLSVPVKVGQNVKRNDFLKKLIEIQYTREDDAPTKGNFRVRGDIVDVYLGYEDTALRIHFFGDEIEKLEELDPINMSALNSIDETMIFPAKHYVITEEQQKDALGAITEELKEQVALFEQEGKMLEAHRINQRTRYDLEMIKNLGYCNGIENYSRYFDRRQAGQPPYCLLNFFPEDFLLIIDESHVTIPQVHGMFKGDWSRKANLVGYGFRLPSAHDNRPLKFEEFEKFMRHVIFVSATPADYERRISQQIVAQIIRPTGLLDPKIEVRKIEGQMDDLLSEIHKTTDRGNKVLVTTLTKRMAEDLTEYMEKAGVRVRYLHSEIETLERTEILRQLRANQFDVLVGINLLREGLDLPEVELVAILDADKEGFLRTEKSLIQTVGRAARNAEGRVIMYADKMTEGMKSAIKITHERREKQIQYNKKHGIVPKTIKKAIPEAPNETKLAKDLSGKDMGEQIKILELEMRIAADQLDFERAIALRDQMNLLEKRLRAMEKKVKQ
jgi:excinuclease ABC subunit B